MAQIVKKFIGDNQVADEKIRLDNNQNLRSRNAADDGDVNLIKADTADIAEIGRPVKVLGTGSVEGYVDIFEETNTSRVRLKAANSINLSSNVSFTLPFADGTSGQVLRTDGAGVLSFVTIAAAGTPGIETFVLNGTDISNGYIDLSVDVTAAASVDMLVQGAPSILQGASYDYTVALGAGVGATTRITFENDLATGGAAALVAGDVVQVRYLS